MTRQFALPLIALAFATPLAAQQSVQDFQLPPAPTPTASPNVQGPVDTEATVPVAPRVIRPQASPAPTASAQPSPTPSPTASATPQPALAAQPTPRPTVGPPAAQRPVPTPTQATQPPPPEIETIPGTPIELPAAPEGLAPQPTATATAAPLPGAVAETSWLPWIGGGLALLLLAGGGWLWRRRSAGSSEPPTIAPPIAPREAEPPLQEDQASLMPKSDELEAAIAKTDTPPPQPKDPLPAPVFGTPHGARGALTLEAEAVKLSRSMVYARLSYLLRITNGTKDTLEQVEIAGDMVSASSGRPVAEQVAGDATPLERQHLVDRLEPGETHFAKGELALPLGAVDPIMQGRTPLLVPLMRWRVSAANGATMTHTHVVGLKPQEAGGRLQPFRLDIPPQTFDTIGNRPVG